MVKPRGGPRRRPPGFTAARERANSHADGLVTAGRCELVAVSSKDINAAASPGNCETGLLEAVPRIGGVLVDRLQPSPASTSR